MFFEFFPKKNLYWFLTKSLLTLHPVEGIKYTYQEGIYNMKINEVETLVGITKKNIRFYEEQGLISPGRNKDNGYRSYDECDIKKLEQIKLFRKLGVPIEEIRSMQQGSATVSDCMKRHIISLQRKQSNLTHAIELCNELKELDILLLDLDAHSLLDKMEEKESTGAAFKNIRKNDIKAKRYAGAFLASIAIILMAIATLVFILWTYKTVPEETPPIWFFSFIILALLAVIIGVVYALIQRVGEIQKGEIDDAREF